MICAAVVTGTSWSCSMLICDFLSVIGLGSVWWNCTVFDDPSVNWTFLHPNKNQICICSRLSSRFFLKCLPPANGMGTSIIPYRFKTWTESPVPVVWHRWTASWTSIVPEFPSLEDVIVLSCQVLFEGPQIFKWDLARQNLWVVLSWADDKTREIFTTLRFWMT